MTAGGLARQFGRPGASFYDGTPGHELAKCPDCGRNADALFGDHGGDCLTAVAFPIPKSGLGIVRAHALDHGRFSMNDLREKFLAAGVRKSSRAPALIAAVKNGWLEVDGNVPSNDPKTKGHRIQVYRSLIVNTRTKVGAR